MKKICTIILTTLVLAVVLAIGIFFWLSSPLDRQDTSIRSIVVAKGETGASIASDLQDKHIIKSAVVLRLWLRSKDSLAVIQTGTYELSPAMSTSEVAGNLLKGSKDIWITLKEGWRTEEINDALTSAFGLRFFDPTEFGSLAKGKEGTLFPDTYLLPKQSGAQIIINTLTGTFQKRYQSAVDELGNPVLPQDQTIILASLVQREAKNPTDMRLVAGILINRLKAGIPLQVDSTLEYVKGYDSVAKSWWSQPKGTDRDLVSPFNTYLNKGLPPTAICNPGLDALKAAIAPTSSDYLFYISDNQGNMHYARTLEEHNANIDQYLK